MENKLKVLVVDDNDGDRALFKSHIRKHGYVIDILEAVNAEDAFVIMRDNQDLNCVFLDYQLPDMDGVSVLREIYDVETDLAPFPIVMLTGQGSEAVATDAIRLGAQDYLIKDQISTNTLHIALTKAKEVFDLKKSRNQAISRLEQAQKMDAIGKLTGGIAHDFNNLLTINLGNTKLLMDMLRDETLDVDKCIERLKTIEKATRRGSELVKRLMIFSRQRQLDPVTVDINKAVKNIGDLLQRSLGEMVTVRSEVEAESVLIDVDEGQLENAIINMGVNARDAMPDGGEFILRVRNVTLDDPIASSMELSPGGYVCLSVEDTGFGMSEDILNNIFDPFFTTKDVGQGTGLGLSMVYGFVRETGGAVRAQSNIGEGTQFHLYFPKSENALLESVENENDLLPIMPGCETILVVEDEQEIRAMTTMFLRSNGYNILEAEDGIEALHIIQSTKEDVDLIFTDIAMPGGMNGVQMAARAQVLEPNVRLLFTTGYSSAATPDMALIENYPILNKPYEPDALIKKIQEVLND